MRECKLIKSQRGLSLIEQMVAMTIGLLVIGTVVATYLSGSRGNTDIQRMARIDNELRGVATLVAKDLRRAGYASANKFFYTVSDGFALTWSGGHSAGDSVTLTAESATAALFTSVIVGNKLRYGDGSNHYYASITSVPTTCTSPASVSGTCFTVTLDANFPSTVSQLPAGTWAIISSYTAIGDSNLPCILLSYDDRDTTTADFFGFRYDSTNQAVEARTSSGGTCASTSGWQAISDPAVLAVTAFNITKLSTPVTNVGIDGVTQIEVKEYQIQITGRLRKDTTSDPITRTVMETVRLRNEALIN